MRRIFCLTLFILLTAGLLWAQDPVQTNPEKYKVLLENDRVRVLDYQDNPGEKTAMHHHPDSILYALSSFTRKLTLGNGKSMRRDFKAGDCLWMKAHSHIAENIGKSPTHLLIIELKEPAETPVPQSQSTGQK